MAMARQTVRRVSVIDTLLLAEQKLTRHNDTLCLVELIGW
jgi:hypothetical protein